ncbi:Hypothetical_protein [Hexamita inflata]|uniref:Hypothetical_protein n=1 Tax=Hexamita inflata TaxID=28002 RepID=A0ABP1KIY8_9EUKA
MQNQQLNGCMCWELWNVRWLQVKQWLHSFWNFNGWRQLSERCFIKELPEFREHLLSDNNNYLNRFFLTRFQFIATFLRCSSAKSVSKISMQNPPVQSAAVKNHANNENLLYHQQIDINKLNISHYNS